MANMASLCETGYKVVSVQALVFVDTFKCSKCIDLLREICITAFKLPSLKPIYHIRLFNDILY